jgi:predicted metal-dependent peptidase
MMTEDETTIKNLELSGRILQLSRDQLMLAMKYISIALNRLKLKPAAEFNGFATDADSFFYNPADVLMVYKEEKSRIARIFLHSVIHCLLNHPFRLKDRDAALWNICADIATESIVLEFEAKQFSLRQDTKKASLLASFKSSIGFITAEKLYRFFKSSETGSEDLSEIADLFFADDHSFWNKAVIGQKDEAQSIQAGSSGAELQLEWDTLLDLENKRSGTGQEDTAGLLGLLLAATGKECKEKQSYREFLKRFIVTDEEIKTDPEEFDYGLYSYGLQLYDNMPLIEPLEYKEVEKIKELVVAIDTSGSCQGLLVREFLRKTYDIMKSTENFFHKTNMYIIQADDRVRSSRHITCDEDFDKYLRHEKLAGFGETDFRPVFHHVDQLIRDGHLQNLKGLIYFTDGFGVFPEWAPSYDSVFVLIKGNNNAKEVPAWAIKAEFN